MQLPEPTQNPYSPIADADQLVFDAPPPEDTALALVLQDTDRAETFLMSKEWARMFDDAAVAWINPAKPAVWPGTNYSRSSVTLPVVATTVESLLPTLLDALVGDPQPVQFQPRPGTQPEYARAQQELATYLMTEAHLRDNLEEGLRMLLTYGIGIWRQGWERYKRKVTVYERAQQPVQIPAAEGGTLTIPTDDDGPFSTREIEIEVNRPTLEPLDPRFCLCDPNCRSTNWATEARYVIFRNYLTADDLDNLREFDGYDIPDRDTLRQLFMPPKEPTHGNVLESSPLVIEREFSPLPRWEPGTVDPLAQPIEVLERWDRERVIVVLNRKLVIKNEMHGFNRLPLLTAAWAPIPGSAYGYGLGQLLRGEQSVQQSILNARLDELALNLMGTYVRKRGVNDLSQDVRLRPGGVIDVDDSTDNLRALQRLPAVPEAFAEVEASEARVERISGANELTVMGALPEKGRSSITRTATGVNTLAGAAGSRIQNVADRVATNVLVPFALFCVTQAAQFMSPKQVRQILSQELDQAYQAVDPYDVLNARVRVECWAGSKLAAKRALAGALPLLFHTLTTGEIASNLPQFGERVNLGELVQLLFDVTGYRDRQAVIQALPPGQAPASPNPVAEKIAVIQAKGQVQAQLQSQKQQQQNASRLQQIQESASAKALAPAVADKAFSQAEDHVDRQGDMNELRTGLADGAEQNLEVA